MVRGGSTVTACCCLPFSGWSSNLLLADDGWRRAFAAAVAEAWRSSCVSGSGATVLSGSVMIFEASGSLVLAAAPPSVLVAVCASTLSAPGEGTGLGMEGISLALTLRL